MRSGRTAYFNGLAAEEIAARLYTSQGGRVLAERWKCPEGEIDLIIGFPKLIVFVEVKARRRFDAATSAISPKQWQRLGQAASRYLAEKTDGTPDCRFDAVLVDATGQAERIENAHSFDGW
jgi:putative endonuclease